MDKSTWPPPTDRQVTKVFKALSDGTRQQILQLLEGEQRTVGEIVKKFSLSQPTISHHLRILREAGLVESTRRGTWAFYRLVPEALGALRGALGA